jgi:ACT domain-containing protein
MIVDISSITEKLSVLAGECNELGKQIGMSIYMQHEDIFNAMHNV